MLGALACGLPHLSCQYLLRQLLCPLLRALFIMPRFCLPRNASNADAGALEALETSFTPPEVPPPRLLVRSNGKIQVVDMSLPPMSDAHVNASSYDETEVLDGDVEGEILRLQLQVELTFEKEMRLMRW